MTCSQLQRQKSRPAAKASTDHHGFLHFRSSWIALGFRDTTKCQSSDTLETRSNMGPARS